MLGALVDKLMGENTESIAQRGKPSSDFIERDIDAVISLFREILMTRYSTIWRDIHVLK